MSKSGKPIHSDCTLSHPHVNAQKCHGRYYFLYLHSVCTISGDNQQQLNTVVFCFLFFFYPDISTYHPGWDANLHTSAFKTDVTGGFLLLWCDALALAFLPIPAVELAPILYFCLSKY